MKGRPKDPNRTRRRTGHRRKPDEPIKLRAVPVLREPEKELVVEPPAHLSPEARNVWVELVGEMGDLPLKPSDFLVLETLVTQYLRMRQAAALIEKYDIIRLDSEGRVDVNRFVRMERDAAMAVLRLSEQFGLTLAGRMRLGLMALQGRSMSRALADDLNG